MQAETDASGDLVLDSRGRLALYLAVGLRRRLGHRAADRHHARLRCRQLDALRFVRRQPRHAGLRPHQRGDGSRHRLVLAPLAALGGARPRTLGPLAVAANLFIQQLGFNPIYLVADPHQKWKLAAIFVASLMPFLGGAVFLGSVFLKSNKTFGRVYFADLAGSGLSGLVVPAAQCMFSRRST